MASLSPQELHSLLPASTPAWQTELAPVLGASWSALLGTEVVCAVRPAAEHRVAATASCLVNCSLNHHQPEHESAHTWTVWEVDRHLAAAIIDAQTGATQVSPVRSHNALTEIEQTLIRRALLALAAASNNRFDERASFAEFTELTTFSEGGAVERGQVTWPESPTAVTFEFRLLDTSGQLTWWLPTEKQRWFAPPATRLPPSPHVAVLAEIELPVCDVGQLVAGDVIVTDQAVHAPIQLISDSRSSRRATVGSLGGFRAVQLLADDAIHAEAKSRSAASFG
ncbi:MAG: FliM/FliN family flagellar motor switch protein [Planctomycetales bacterium]|nr:FliM/FliN family flagellar motor switch protein [Planctomycetales bacterium]